MSRVGGWSWGTTVLLVAAAFAWSGAASASAAPTKKPDQVPGKPPKSVTAPVTAHGSGTGIVQSLVPRGVVLRQLDGTLVRVGIGPKTIVIVNGARAKLGDVAPGYVARFSGAGAKGIAALLRATNPSGGRQAGAAVAGPASPGTTTSGASSPGASMTARESRGRSSG